jgi:stress response protein SCP2
METKSWSAQKGNKFNLSKEQTIFIPQSMSSVMVGLGWDTKADIDASVLMLDDQGEVVDYVSFSKLTSSDGSVKHQGDNLTGEGDGDDE